MWKSMNSEEGDEEIGKNEERNQGNRMMMKKKWTTLFFFVFSSSPFREEEIHTSLCFLLKK